MNKPPVFNYADYVKLHGECVKLKAENWALKNALKAALYDIAHECDTCKFVCVGYDEEPPCSRCRGANEWEWRGVKNG